jgi:hypothetical protein
MASLPKSDPSPRPLSIDELFAIRGTPEFDAEYRRQLAAIAEHDRRTHNSSRMEVDWESLSSWK